MLVTRLEVVLENLGQLRPNSFPPDLVARSLAFIDLPPPLLAILQSSGNKVTYIRVTTRLDQENSNHEKLQKGLIKLINDVSSCHHTIKLKEDIMENLDTEIYLISFSQNMEIKIFKKFRFPTKRLRSMGYMILTIPPLPVLSTRLFNMTVPGEGGKEDLCGHEVPGRRAGHQSWPGQLI